MFSLDRNFVRSGLEDKSAYLIVFSLVSDGDWFVLCFKITFLTCLAFHRQNKQVALCMAYIPQFARGMKCSQRN